MNSRQKDNDTIRSLVVFDPAIRGKFIESRIACEGGFTSQPAGHNDIFDFCIPYHSGSNEFSSFCEEQLNIHYVSKKTKLRPTRKDEEVDLVFNEKFHCASAKNGMSIEVKTTTTNAFNVKQTQGHLIEPETTKEGDVKSYSLDTYYRHADFYLLIQLEDPDETTNIDKIFSLVKDVWVVPTYRLEQEILDKKESLTVGVQKLNKNMEAMRISKFPTRFNRPQLIASYLKHCFENEINEFGKKIAEHKRDVDNSKGNALKQKFTQSTIPVDLEKVNTTDQVQYSSV